MSATAHVHISHAKSRNGCSRCKSRKVKCDEERPKCRSCIVRDEDCDYPDKFIPPRRRPHNAASPGEKSVPDNGLLPLHPASAVAGNYGTSQSENAGSSYPSEAREPRSLSSTPAATLRQEIPFGSTLNMVDLKLLQQFMQHTSKHMTSVPEKRIVWERVIPSMATENELLMHLVLAVAGLHLICEDGDHSQYPYGIFSEDRATVSTPSNDRLAHAGKFSHKDLRSSSNEAGSPVQRMKMFLLEVAIEHHQKGLERLRKELDMLSDSNTEAAFVASILVAAYAFASLRVENMGFKIQAGESNLGNGSMVARRSPIQEDMRLEWLHLVYGIISIASQNYLPLRMSRIRPLVTYKNFTRDWEQMSTNLLPEASVNDDPAMRRWTLFCAGARQAISALNASETCQQPTSSATDDLAATEAAAELARAVHLLKEAYMRILYVYHFSSLPQSSTSDRVDPQAEFEDAAVMGWPQHLTKEFLSMLELHDDPEKVNCKAFVVLAHFYLILALFQNFWWLKGIFEMEIKKIAALEAIQSETRWRTLMDWPLEVSSI